MRRVARLAFAVVIAATGPILAACDSLETFELFDTKKKLTGERKPVFPEGVPGATSGIPAELVKGYREPEHADVTDPARVAAEAAAEAAKPKPRPAAAPAPAKPPTQRTAAKPPAKPAADTSPSTTAQSGNGSQAAPAASSAPAVGQPGGPPLPWPNAPQPQAAWPAGTVAR